MFNSKPSTPITAVIIVLYQTYKHHLKEHTYMFEILVQFKYFTVKQIYHTILCCVWYDCLGTLYTGFLKKGNH